MPAKRNKHDVMSIRDRLISFTGVILSEARVLLRGKSIENDCSIAMGQWDCFAGTYLNGAPGMLCFHRISQAKYPFQLLIVEVAPVDYNRLRAWSVMLCHYMAPQGFEDDLPSTLIKRSIFARWAVVVAYMQWWIIW